MARYPRIDSPCPYKSQAASFMDGEMCRLCQRQVFDLSAMEEEARTILQQGLVNTNSRDEGKSLVDIAREIFGSRRGVDLEPHPPVPVRPPPDFTR